MGHSENQPQKQVMDYVKNSLWKVDFPEIVLFKLFRVNSVGIRGRRSTLPPGFPDLCGHLRLKHYQVAISAYIEIKNPSETCKNKDQLLFLSDAKHNGCVSFWCNSLEDFKDKLRDSIVDLVYV